MSVWGVWGHLFHSCHHAALSPLPYSGTRCTRPLSALPPLHSPHRSATSAGSSADPGLAQDTSSHCGQRVNEERIMQRNKGNALALWVEEAGGVHDTSSHCWRRTAAVQ